MKAVRGAEIGRDSLLTPGLAALSDGEVREKLAVCDDNRLFVIYEALRRGVTPEEIHAVTRIDRWFLCKLRHLAEMDRLLEAGPLDAALYRRAKRLGYPDKVIAA